MPMLWVAIILGIVEGVTEFLPISSTGHLIIAGSAMGFEGTRAEAFEIFIQLGAVLAVVWEYRRRLWRVVRDLPSRPEARGFAWSLFVAFVPAAVVGLLAKDFISERLFSPRTVALALVAGSILIFVVEGARRRTTTTRAESVSRAQALGIGIAQCLALWPGFSRSAATILGGLALGLDRRSSTEFSFFLAIPTLGAATVYSLIRHLDHLEAGDPVWLAIAFVVSFFVAWLSIRWLLRFVSTHTLRPFAWYRLALAVAVWVVLEAL